MSGLLQGQCITYAHHNKVEQLLREWALHRAKWLVIPLPIIRFINTKQLFLLGIHI